VPVKENIFYLRNLKYNEDLFASNDFDLDSREVFTSKFEDRQQQNSASGLFSFLNKQPEINEKNFMWNIRRTKENPNKYTIWNVANNEPL